jgi:peptide/nickel transport system substrate-binding protein
MKQKSIFTLAAVVLLLSMVLGACAQPPAPTTEAAPPTAAAAPTEVPPTEAPPPTEVPAATEAPTAAPPEKSTIIIGTTDKVASLDPADGYAVRDWELIKNTGEGLLRFKPGTTELEPALATGMPVVSEDGLTYTLTLRDGIKFGDGTDLTATMYAEELNRLLTIGPDCPNGVASALATPYLASITAPDDKTIVFTLKAPTGYFAQLLATAPYVPASPKLFPADQCVLFPPAPVFGVGPWIITQYTQGEQWVLEPNPYYNGVLKPQVDQIIVKDFADPQTLSLAVQNGEVDVAWRYLGPEIIGQLKGVSGVSVNTVPGGSIRYLIINHAIKPMDDPNVYKALASAIDRNQIADTVYGGQVSPLYSMVPPGFIGAAESFDTMYASPDLDKAKEYLAASGYTESNPLTLELWYPPEHYGAETAAWMELIKQQFEATGAVKVDLKAQEWSTYVTALTGGESYPAGVLGWFFDYPDSSNYLDPFVYNDGEGTNVSPRAEGTDFGKPINDQAQKLVDLLAQADKSSDQAERADLYAQAQEIYADLVVTLPLFFNAEYITYRPNIQGSSDNALPETLNIGPAIEFWYSMLSKTQ